MSPDKTINARELLAGVRDQIVAEIEVCQAMVAGECLGGNSAKERFWGAKILGLRAAKSIVDVALLGHASDAPNRNSGV